MQIRGMNIVAAKNAICSSLSASIAVMYRILQFAHIMLTGKEYQLLYDLSFGS